MRESFIWARWTLTMSLNRKDEPVGNIETSTLVAFDLFMKSGRDLFVMFIKTKLCVGIRGSIEHHVNMSRT